MLSLSSGLDPWLGTKIPKLGSVAKTKKQNKTKQKTESKVKMEELTLENRREESSEKWEKLQGGGRCQF